MRNSEDEGPKMRVEDVEAMKSALLCDEPPSFPKHEIEWAVNLR